MSRLALDSPELPDAVRPRWPAWNAPVALLSGFGVTIALGAPLIPVILVGLFSDTLNAFSLLVLVVVQDAALVGAALVFANITLRPRGWHFGVRATPLWATVGLAVLAFALLLGAEVGWIELLRIDEGNLEDFDDPTVAAGIAFAVMAIVVAPVAEELFFRAFFYRALRTRLKVWSAALIDGLVFGALHFQGVDRDALLVPPLIAVVGVGLCLLYERTGSIFAVVAVHVAFNTVAMLGVAPVPALVAGSLMLLACLIVPARVGRRPSPLPA